MTHLAVVVVVAALGLVTAEQPGFFVRELGPASVRLGGVSPTAAEVAAAAAVTVGAGPQRSRLTDFVSNGIVQAIEGLRESMVTGSELHPPLDPLRVDQIGPFDIGTDGFVLFRLRTRLDDLEISGASDFVIEELIFNPVGLRFTFRLTLPEMSVQTEYDSEARLALVITHRAAGHANIVVSDISVEWVVQLALVDGRLQATELQLDVSVGHTYVSLTEVTGVGVIDLVLNWVLQNVSSDAVQIALANISQAVSQGMFETINDVLSRWNLNNLQEEYIINQHIDDVLPQLSDFMFQNGLDPMPLPDIEESFYHKPLLITYRGVLLISEGQLTNLKSIRRSEDVFVRIFARILRFRMAFGFEDLEIRYNYLAKLMDIGPTGGIRGSLDRIDIVVDCIFDANNWEMHLQQFELTHGRLRVRMTGNFLTDWFVNLISTVFLGIFNNVIIRVVESTIRDVLQDSIHILNELIKNELASLS